MIRGVLGSRASIGGVLGSGRGGASLWYLAGGVSAANCVAAYQPIGAVSLAASYTNLANPGTYTAAAGVAPTFDTATGWTFASQYLRTGITPGSGWSMIVKYTDVTNTGIIAGSDGGAGSRFWLRPNDGAGNVNYAYAANVRAAAPALLSGTLCIAALNCYRNGSADGTITASTLGALYEIYIGARNLGGATFTINAKVQAFAIYNTTLDAATVAALSAAMAAL